MMLYLRNLVVVVVVVVVTLANKGNPAMGFGCLVVVGGCQVVASGCSTTTFTTTFLPKNSCIMKGYYHYNHFLTFFL